MSGLAKAERGLLSRSVEDALKSKNWADEPQAAPA
jgi:hypothetical protein